MCVGGVFEGSFHSPTCPSTCPSTYPFIHLPTHPSTHTSPIIRLAFYPITPQYSPYPVPGLFRAPGTQIELNHPITLL